ncbi:ABC transporter substrate-binding protein [Streptosporangium canum]|uniref:ABC transporter substrate-binding protein n=1 Tax=Streptosporangium canum TaxID=324952 RepID=UPI0036B9C430
MSGRPLRSCVLRAHHRLLTVTFLLVAVVSAACGSPQTPPAPGAGPEKTSITVGTMPIPDVVAFYLAQSLGLFAREGFREVKVETIQGAGPAIPLLNNGSMDFAILNYVTAFAAQDKEIADLRFVADAYQAVPNTFAVMAPARSSAKTLADLRGKTIAVATFRSIGTLTLEVALRIHGLTSKDVHLVEMPLPNMPAALASGAIQAAWMTEPFITAAGHAGAVKLADMATGPTDAFPIAGWGVSAEFAAKNPRTVRAFQRAMAVGQQIAADNRTTVVRVIPGYTSIKKDIAKVITLGEFPRTLSSTRLQRVADQMIEFGYLDKPLDVAPLLLPPATPAATSTNGAS